LFSFGAHAPASLRLRLLEEEEDDDEEEEDEEDDEEEEEEGLFKADAVNEDDPERDRATQV